jgi:hypothetical protein
MVLEVEKIDAICLLFPRLRCLYINAKKKSRAFSLQLLGLSMTDSSKKDNKGEWSTVLQSKDYH